jgi:hypothetical protein
VSTPSLEIFEFVFSEHPIQNNFLSPPPGTMIYHQSPIVNFEVDWVIFDEIHYLNDYDRGVVWEEVIILLPKQISLVMLSATVSNVEVRELIKVVT